MKYNVDDVILLNPKKVTSTRGKYYADNKIPLRITSTRDDGYRAIAVSDNEYPGDFRFDNNRVLGLANELAFIRLESKRF
jgi:hypothetical protein